MDRVSELIIDATRELDGAYHDRPSEQERVCAVIWALRMCVESRKMDLDGTKTIDPGLSSLAADIIDCVGKSMDEIYSGIDKANELLDPCIYVSDRRNAATVASIDYLIDTVDDNGVIGGLMAIICAIAYKLSITNKSLSDNIRSSLAKWNFDQQVDVDSPEA